MNNINKKVFVPVIAGIVVIIIAVVIFIVIGNSQKGAKGTNNKISFNVTADENTTVENETVDDEDTSNDTNSTNTTEKNFDDENFDAYKEVCKKFGLAYTNLDDMQELVDDYFDLKAYLAYQNVNGDESKFMDEYNSIDDDDPKIEEMKNSLLAVPQFFNMMIQMAKQSGDESNASELENFKVEFLEITNIEESEYIEEMKHVTAKLKMDDQEGEVTFVFYDTILVSILGDNGQNFAEMGEQFIDTNNDDTMEDNDEN